MDFHWDSKELPRGYDHDGERRKLKKIKEAEYAPAGGDAGLPKLGTCTACHRDAVHRWPDGTLICSKHWTRQLERRLKDMQDHPEFYKEEATGKRAVSKPRRTKTVSPSRRTKSDYGAKGNDNWQRRAAQ